MFYFSFLTISKGRVLFNGTYFDIRLVNILNDTKMKEKEQSVRFQESLLSKAEKRFLTYLAKRTPSWVTSDMLTAIGVVGSIIVAIGYILSNENIYFLWLATFGFFVNWYGDSLDGTLARVRKCQRPVWGFFIDHNVDGITVAIMCIGAGLSGILSLYVAMLVLVAYLILSIYTYINTHLKNEFRISYNRIGPTEFRLVMMILNTIFLYIEPLRNYSNTFSFYGSTITLGIFDYLGIVIFLFIIISHFMSVYKDGKIYYKMDPPKKIDCGK